MYRVADHVPLIDKIVVMETIKRDEVLRLYAEGGSLAAVSEATGVSAHHVRVAVLEAGIMRSRNAPRSNRTEKRCPRCKVTKPLEEFGQRRYVSGRMGPHGYCKPCNVEATRLWAYGLSREDFERMVAEQGGCCAICGERPDPEAELPRQRVLHIDHDHATGAVRQLLCWKCNCGLGNFGDDIDKMTAALAYLVKHRAGGQ